MTITRARPVQIACEDGLCLSGHLWPAPGESTGLVIINPATGVRADYYHRYAQFLTAHRFSALTYDYRGIGASRPASLRGCGYKWRDWGMLDFAAALGFAQAAAPGSPLLCVGHSIGGYLPGLAANAAALTRLLTVGAQYAFWPDYAAQKRLGLLAKWHLAMPALTALYGYFPGKKLGWLEDLPKGVAYEWSFRGALMERTHPPHERPEILRRFSTVTAPILAVTLSDDEFATLPAIRRTLAYYTSARKQAVMLHPADFGHEKIGHFGLFHARHKDDFWAQSVKWLQGGANPWPHRALGV
ncbi:alpha/beta fold hydrolase [Acidocella sp.]|uniref:alpha/beta hydrolase family protein n=1 Tax=Acidocella sp. TaxID=50710 RepID=UPI002622016F|nr:alpha/beta fold hydrolase [Acidocella sp.]